MRYKSIAFILAFTCCCAATFAQRNSHAANYKVSGPATYVNPFIGASTSAADAGVYHGLGKTFPGATTPYGMVQLSPNTITGGDYNHANEPVHHIPFLYNRLGAPWLTQKWSREICRRAYKNSVEGLVGNEDVGQMSAWYVLAASGIHPVCPGDTRQEITSPVFDKITFRLDPKYDKGKTFTIIAKNNSAKNIYIQSAKLNGQPYSKCHLDYKNIASGGVLELTMGNEPNKSWGIN
ncbi:glycoside hydrolase domain-containing protein [Mucilaginibacter sp.]|uniref:glycoside hydrolase domain-containing protein n=1 Tax=Mucilaginibacter sp. TaxID=1882438 RepID=UPI0025EBF2B4|nr:glycoside hydrolase domain-containing protein [Mucilaginibacter sp.]